LEKEITEIVSPQKQIMKHSKPAEEPRPITKVKIPIQEDQPAEKKKEVVDPAPPIIKVMLKTLI
jgi:hypothetical protein